MGVYYHSNEWLPGPNTVAYYPLKADVNDYSGNYRNMINFGITFTSNNTGATIPVGYLNGDDKSYLGRATQLSSGYTISLFQKTTANNTSFIFDLRNDSEYGQGVYLVTEGGYFKTRQQKSSNTEEEYSRTINQSRNHWVLTWTGSVWTVYFNGTQVKQATINNSINTSNTTLSFGCRYSLDSGYYSGYISNFIVENTPRTADDVKKYYNSMCTIYGLQPIN